jgi:hypothetical protein
MHNSWHFQIISKENLKYFQNKFIKKFGNIKFPPVPFSLKR